MLRVHAGAYDDIYRNNGNKGKKNVANRILALAIQLHERQEDSPTIIVSKSMNLRLKADALGIYAEDYLERFNTEEDYQGFHDYESSEDEINAFLKSGELKIEEDFFVNDYVHLTNGDGASALGRVSGEEGHTLQRIYGGQEPVMGIKPLNLPQTFALDALLDDDIKLVTLKGKAGTGKTLIAVAAGLQKMYVEDKYRKMLISRPTLPMGRDIGFIPGSVEEKMRPWMQPIYDAVELLCEVDRRTPKRIIPPDIMESEDLKIEPLTYIRGRSIPNQYMIIDEAQNLTPLEVKTIITRVGFGTKIIFTGDPEQIDNPYVDRLSNGFSYLINRFQNEKIAAHVSLTKGERSDLAELAANIL